MDLRTPEILAIFERCHTKAVVEAKKSSDEALAFIAEELKRAAQHANEFVNALEQGDTAAAGTSLDGLVDVRGDFFGELQHAGRILLAPPPPPPPPPIAKPPVVVAVAPVKPAPIPKRKTK